MSSFEIFNLLFTDFMKKFDADTPVFTHKYALGKQQIRIHLLKSDDKSLAITKTRVNFTFLILLPLTM